MSQRPNFAQQFEAFAKFGDIRSDGKSITLSQSDKWMKQAKIINDSITTTDTAILFKKLKLNKVDINAYQRFLKDLATVKNVPFEEILNNLSSCGEPKHPKFKKSGKTAVTVQRLTDTTKYTGSHKERFDKSGKGKGIAGRKDVVKHEGYVSGYIHKDTYEETH